MTARFTVQGLETGGADLLGIWQAAPAPATMASFGAPAAPGAASEAGEVVWSVWLPADPRLAGAAMRHGAEALAATQLSVSRAGQMLDGLPGRWLEATSFSLETGAQGMTPEATLRRNLLRLQTGQAEVSFGLALPGDWAGVLADYRAFVQRVFRLLRPTLRVETRVEGALLASTRVRPDGDVATGWSRQGVAVYHQLHYRSLSLSLQSRLALLQLLAQISAGAAALAARLSLPGGALLAMPAIWRYFQDVMQQAQQVADV